jgi:hypothetical protein
VVLDRLFFCCLIVCHLIILLASQWILIFHIRLQLSPGNMLNSGKSTNIMLWCLSCVRFFGFRSVCFFSLPPPVALSPQYYCRKKSTKWRRSRRRDFGKRSFADPLHQDLLCHSPHPWQYLNVKGLLSGEEKTEEVLPSFN